MFMRKLPKTLSNVEDGKQLIKSSGSIGANYIEANEKLGERDLYMRLKIARKEAKESSYWLRLLKDMNDQYEKEAEILIDEVLQLRMILSSILNKVSKSKEEIT